MKRNLLPSCKIQTGLGMTPGIITRLDSVTDLNGGEGQACLQSGVEVVNSHRLRFNYGGEAPASSGPVSALWRLYLQQMSAGRYRNQVGVSCSGGSRGSC